MVYTSKDGIKVQVYEKFIVEKGELTPDSFDFQVRLPKGLLLETYAEILHTIERDSVVVPLSGVTVINKGYETLISGELMEHGFAEMADEIYDGNYRDFLFSLVGKEEETGICRIVDPVFKGTHVKGFLYALIG